MAQQTIRLTVGQAIVKYLQVQYSERDGIEERLIPGAFGILGHGNVGGLGQAIKEYGGKDFPFYQPFHEQSMVHTAAGFAKMKNRRATLACAASIGPGSTNMLTGAATATINRLPVLLLAADYYATRYQGPVLQQLEHPISADMSVNDCFRPVSRFFDRIVRPEHLLTALPQAMRVLTSPSDTGAVTISIPQDVQAEAYDYPVHFFERRVWRIERPIPSEPRIREALQLLKQSKRPFIIAGGGVHYAEAREALGEFSVRLGIPVAETFAGKAAVPGSHAKYLLGGLGVAGNPKAGAGAKEADLIIAVGTRLADFITGSQSLFENENVKFIGINVCALDAYKQGALPVLGDAKLALEQLLEAAEAAGYATDDAWRRRAETLRAEWRKMRDEEICVTYPGEKMSQQHAMKVVNDFCSPGDVVITAAGSPPADMLQLWDAEDGTLPHIEFGFSCMGYEIPAALGVKMAAPERGVYAFVGDGTYLMSNSEIITALREGLKVTVVLSQNHGYRSIHNLQRRTAGGGLATEFRLRDRENMTLSGEYAPYDLVGHARSMGAKTFHADDEPTLRQALEDAAKESGPAVIVVDTEPLRFNANPEVWWDSATAEVSGVKEVQEARLAFEEGRKKQRFHY